MKQDTFNKKSVHGQLVYIIYMCSTVQKGGKYCTTRIKEATHETGHYMQSAKQALGYSNPCSAA